jgi:hypothetical protein
MRRRIVIVLASLLCLGVFATPWMARGRDPRLAGRWMILRADGGADATEFIFRADGTGAVERWMNGREFGAPLYRFRWWSEGNCCIIQQMSGMTDAIWCEDMLLSVYRRLRGEQTQNRRRTFRVLLTGEGRARMQERQHVQQAADEFEIVMIND